MSRHAGRSRPGRAGRLLRGPQDDPRWARPALLGLLALTALLYLWDLGRNGWANDFYAAAVQAGTKSWKAFFFGSFDAVQLHHRGQDAGLAVGDGAVRRGYSASATWSMLAPQALEGVGSVLLLYAAVKRWFGPAAGLIAGLVLALTPAAALMFRFNNPDALLVLLMTAAAYTLVRAVENGRTRWLVFTGLLIGFAFLAKMLQAFLVVPGFAARLPVGRAAPAGQADLADAADGSRHRRRRGLVDPGRAAHPGGGPALLRRLDQQQHPAARHRLQRPGRLTGDETGSVGPGGGGGGGGQGASFGGATGLFRLFHAEFGGQISWLLPAALISLAAMAWVSRRAARTDRTRAAALLWGGWVLVTGLVFSYMNGIIHPYYMVALAPGIAALVGIGARALWQPRPPVPVRGAGRADHGRRRRPGQRRVGVHPARPDAGLAAVAALGGAGRGRGRRGPGAGRPGAGPADAGSRRRARLALAAAPLGLALVAGLAGPAAYALDTVGTAQTGAIPSAGPASAGVRRPGRRSRRPGRLPRCRAARPRYGRDRSTRRDAGRKRGGGRNRYRRDAAGRFRRIRRRGRAGRRRPGREHRGEQRPDQAAPAGRGQLQMGGRHRGLDGGGTARAGHWGRGHVHRRVGHAERGHRRQLHHADLPGAERKGWPDDDEGAVELPGPITRLPTRRCSR